MSASEGVVLVIEDHEDVREGFRISLMLDGFVVEVASNGREALAKLYAGLRPFLIIMDLMMPVMDGFEFLQAQLAIPSSPTFPYRYSGVTDPRETAQHLHAAVPAQAD